jgi:hypothetical protein
MLDELHRRRGGDRFRHRGDAKERVGFHRSWFGRVPPAEGGPIDLAALVRRGGGHSYQALWSDTAGVMSRKLPAGRVAPSGAGR